MAQRQELALSLSIFRLSFPIFRFSFVPRKGKMRNEKRQTENAFSSETKPDLRVDTPIVCAEGAAKSAEASRSRRRLSEQARSDVADRIA